MTNIASIFLPGTRREDDLRRANEALQEWRTGWTAAVAQFGLAKDTAAETAEAQIEVIENMREAAGKIRSLRCGRGANRGCR